ncbi:MAG: ribonuclease HI [Burkholderiaceae bacterium]
MTESDLTAVSLYTDGACKGNPGPGGWGALLCANGKEWELFGGETPTTNNRMELMAVIQGMSALTRPCHVTIYTDSSYVKDGIESWLANWKKKGWRTAAGKPVANQDLWQQLEQALQGHTVQWIWVKGHSGHPGNERADALANKGVGLKGQA